MSEIIRSAPSVVDRLRISFRCVTDRDYGPWFVAQIFSASGGLTQSVAAAWLMYRLTHSATHLALLSAAMTLPVLVGGAVAGALADRTDRRRLLLVTQSSFALVGGTLAAASALHLVSAPLLFAAAAAGGTVLAVDGPARQVYVLDLVGTDRLVSAVSLYEIVLNASRIVGPAIAGLLLGASGPTACFCFNAACFLPALAVLLRHGRTRSGPAGAPDHRPARRGSVASGLRYALGTPLIRSCLLLAGVSGVLFNSTVLFPLLAVRSFHLGADGYGLLMAAFGLGALPGALLAATGTRDPDGRRVGLLAAATGTSMVLTAAAPDPGLAYAAMAVTGFASIWFIAAANTLVQLVSAPPMRGRVMGAWTMVLPGLGPVTGLLVATFADAAGPRIAFAVVGVLLLLAASGPVLAARSGRPAGDDDGAVPPTVTLTR